MELHDFLSEGAFPIIVQTMELLPLERIVAWYDTLADNPQQNLAFFVLIRTGKYDPLKGSSRKAFLKWLKEELDYFQHVGRTVHARGMIDYILHKEGNSEEWDDKLDRNLDMLESAGTPKELKPMINEVIPNLINRKPEWVEAARTWRVIRSSHLTDAALHAWEEEMTLRHGLGG